MVANIPTCHRKHSVQKGSSPAGPFGKLARFAFMDAKNACVSPVPLVSGMPAGSEDGTIQPTIARINTMGFESHSTPSLISNPIVGVALCLAGVAVECRRAPRKADTRTPRATRSVARVLVDMRVSVIGVAVMKAIVLVEVEVTTVVGGVRRVWSEQSVRCG